MILTIGVRGSFFFFICRSFYDFYNLIVFFQFSGKVNKAGLFSSTLSSRYDAHTTDSTWVCVFCKQGPHSVVPGDPSRPHPNLAGPHIAPGSYIVSKKNFTINV